MSIGSPRGDTILYFFVRYLWSYTIKGMRNPFIDMYWRSSKLVGSPNLPTLSQMADYCVYKRRLNVVLQDYNVKKIFASQFTGTPYGNSSPPPKKMFLLVEKKKYRQSFILSWPTTPSCLAILTDLVNNFAARCLTRCSSNFI